MINSQLHRTPPIEGNQIQMDETVREPGRRCPACGGELKPRLGQLECTACGFAPPAKLSEGQAQRSQYPSPADARLAFFAPAHYQSPTPTTGSEPLYFSKQLCYRCYVWMLLLPVLGILGIGFWLTSIFAGESMGGGMGSTIGLLWVCIALLAIAWGVDAAIELLILRWVLFGAALWSKWGCLYLIGFRVLLGVYQCLVFMLSGQVGGQPSDPVPANLRWLLLVIGAVWLLQQLWIGFILFCETTERKRY
jgi:hypothetical protein